MACSPGGGKQAEIAARKDTACSNSASGKQIRAGMKKWNERGQDGDLNVMCAILRQPHLLHESVVDPKLFISSLSTVAPTIFCVVDAQTVKIKI